MHRAARCQQAAVTEWRLQPAGVCPPSRPALVTNLTWDVIQHVRLLRCKLHRLLWLLRVRHKPNSSLVSQLQVLLGPPVHCSAVGEPQLSEDSEGWGVGRDGGALDVLDVAVQAAVVAGSGLWANRRSAHNRGRD